MVCLAMMLKDRTGITCDLCSQKLQFVFTYYSAEFKKVMLHMGVRQGEAEKAKGLDWCSACLEKIKQLAVLQYKPTRLVSCDICGSGIVDAIYSTNISEVKVEILAKADAQGNRTGETTGSQKEKPNIIDIISCSTCYDKLCKGVL